MFPSCCGTTQSELLRKLLVTPKLEVSGLPGGFGVFIHLVPLAAVCAENLLS